MLKNSHRVPFVARDCVGIVQGPVPKGLSLNRLNFQSTPMSPILESLSGSMFA